MKLPLIYSLTFYYQKILFCNIFPGSTADVFILAVTGEYSAQGAVSVLGSGLPTRAPARDAWEQEQGPLVHGMPCKGSMGSEASWHGEAMDDGPRPGIIGKVISICHASQSRHVRLWQASIRGRMEVRRFSQVIA